MLKWASKGRNQNRPAKEEGRKSLSRSQASLDSSQLYRKLILLMENEWFPKQNPIPCHCPVPWKWRPPASVSLPGGLGTRFYDQAEFLFSFTFLNTGCQDVFITTLLESHSQNHL
jgi:hypothetical protein